MDPRALRLVALCLGLVACGDSGPSASPPEEPTPRAPEAGPPPEPACGQDPRHGLAGQRVGGSVQRQAQAREAALGDPSVDEHRAERGHG